MQKVLTAEEMREVDRLTVEKYGIPSILLMENAAHAAARVITEKLGGSVKGKSFLILCGKGNNGGDGAALARILWTLGANCFVHLFGKIENTKGDAKINFEILKKFDESKETNAPDENCLFFWETEDAGDLIQIILEEREEVIIDAFFGTGLSKPIAGDLRKVIENLEKLKERGRLPLLISLDIPSGFNADSAESVGENIQADLTVTFTAPKLANVLPPASNFNGELVVANIGSPQELIDNSPSKLFLAEREDAKIWLEKTKFSSASYKNKRGHAFLIVGSRQYSGAAILAGNAAMRSGVGLVSAATTASAHDAVSFKLLADVITHGLPETEKGAFGIESAAEIKRLVEKADVVGIGCGMTSEEQTTKNFVREVVTKRKTPVVIDADALNALAPFDLQGSEDLPLILTPHEGEFLRLLGTKDKEVLKDRVKAVRDFAEKHNVILVLKGERVLIAAPDGTVVINPTGNSGLGKAGNGDTLTGIITGFVAQAAQMKIDIFETVVAAVYISSLAGDIAAEKFGKRAMLASDVRECLGEAFEQLGTPSS